MGSTTAYDASVSTHTGLVRQNNEDSYYLDGRLMKAHGKACRRDSFRRSARESVFAVCDGIGGEQNGEKASGEAVALLQAFCAGIAGKSGGIDELIKEMGRFVQGANDAIYDLAVKDDAEGMGTTFTCLVLCGREAAALNLGDSRVYLMREGQLRQLTTDHTEAERLVRLGIISREQARGHRTKHILSRCLGVSPEEGRMEASVSEIISLAEGDVFLLCSDGLTDMLDDGEIRDVLLGKRVSGKQENRTHASKVPDLAEKLVRHALANGGRDNVTAMVVRINGIA